MAARLNARRTSRGVAIELTPNTSRAIFSDMSGRTPVMGREARGVRVNGALSLAWGAAHCQKGQSIALRNDCAQS